MMTIPDSRLAWYFPRTVSQMIDSCRELLLRDESGAFQHVNKAVNQSEEGMYWLVGLKEVDTMGTATWKVLPR